MSPTATLPPLEREQELAAIFSAYNEMTEQLRLSHEQLEYQVRRLRDELADKNRELARTERLAALGQMAAGLAHEIRNPLGGIQLFACLLERDLEAMPEQLALVRKVTGGVQTLNRLIHEILDFAGEVHVDRARLDVAELVRDCIDMLSAEIDRFGSRVVTEPAEGILLWADFAQMRSALTNLLRNAIEAAGPGGSVVVCAAPIPERDAVELRVTDSGAGIPAEHLDKVFNPFFTTKESGTGLGLSMVHRIVDAHGGHIRVTNGPQGGACFVVELPTRFREAGRDAREADP